MCSTATESSTAFDPSTALTEQDLAGDLALVTGSARGLGSAIAQELAERGARVLIADLAAEDVDREVSRLRALGLDAFAIVVDIADGESVARAVQTTAEQHGDISILINNAGIARAGGIDGDRAVELWNQVLQVNLTGAFQVTAAFLDQLKRTKGRIVNVSSISALRSAESSASYAASKGGLKSLTQSLARELAPHGIRVNAVAPGYMNAPMGRKGDPAGEEWVQWHVPMKRFGEPHELAGPVAFLVSPKASYVDGVTLPVDGGYLVV
jgi:NAD(P)-dependent dehydrogenase (short-subunit alcohol dehydrogenase family)